MKGTFRQLQLALSIIDEPIVNSNSLKYDCPQCKKHATGFGKKNLEVNWGKGIYHCWACNISGGLYKLVSQYGYKEYAVWFKKNEDVTPKELTTVLELPKNISLLQHPQALDYVLGRNISLETIRQTNLRYCYEGEFNKHILFPSYNRLGQLTYFVAHDFYNKKYKERKGPNHICFFENQIDQKLPIVITEGVYDALSVPNAIPLLGLKVTNDLLDFVANKQVIIAIDDEVLETTAKNIYKQLCKVTSKIEIFNCAPFKDLNDFSTKDSALLKNQIYNYYQQQILTYE